MTLNAPGQMLNGGGPIRIVHVSSRVIVEPWMPKRAIHQKRNYCRYPLGQCGSTRIRLVLAALMTPIISIIRPRECLQND